MMYIQPDECINCGLCLSVCPVEAIFEDDAVPANEAAFLAVNAEFFGPYRHVTRLIAGCQPESARAAPRKRFIECFYRSQRPALGQHYRSGNVVRSAAGLADDQQSGETVPGLDVGFVVRIGRSLGDHGEGNDAATDAAQCAAAAEGRFDHSQ